MGREDAEDAVIFRAVKEALTCKHIYIGQARGALQYANQKLGKPLQEPDSEEMCNRFAASLCKVWDTDPERLRVEDV